MENRIVIPQLELGNQENPGIFAAVLRQALLHQVTLNTTASANRVDNQQFIHHFTRLAEQPTTAELFAKQLFQQKADPLAIAANLVEGNMNAVEEIVTAPEMPKCMLMLAGFSVTRFRNSTDSVALEAPRTVRGYWDNELQQLEVPRVPKRRASNILTPIINQVACKNCPFQAANVCLPKPTIKKFISTNDIGLISLKVPYSQFFMYGS